MEPSIEELDELLQFIFADEVAPVSDENATSSLPPAQLSVEELQSMEDRICEVYQVQAKQRLLTIKVPRSPQPSTAASFPSFSNWQELSQLLRLYKKRPQLAKRLGVPVLGAAKVSRSASGTISPTLFLVSPSAVASQAAGDISVAFSGNKVCARLHSAPCA